MTIDDRFIIKRQDNTFVLYAGLLDAAHREGLKRISTTLIQIPCEDNRNVAVVQARVETDRGVFSGIGDASPGNVNRMIAPHLIRMAETRAKARALRDAVNVGMTAFEELGGEDDSRPEQQSQPSNKQGQGADSRVAREDDLPFGRESSHQPGTRMATEKQASAIYALSKQVGAQAPSKDEVLAMTMQQASELIDKLQARKERS